VQAVLYLPDAKNGYYRASRFDWSGVIRAFLTKGHTYFGVWFSHYDPMVADAITGPVGRIPIDRRRSGLRRGETRRSVRQDRRGRARKADDSPYKFMYTYPLVDGASGRSTPAAARYRSRQQLHSPIGIAYDYEKTVSLDAHEPVLTLQHSLKIPGRKRSDTQVYDHDFFMLDGAPSGPGMVIDFLRAQG